MTTDPIEGSEVWAEPPHATVRLLTTLMRDIEVERRSLADQINDDPVQKLAHISRVLEGLVEMEGLPASAAQPAHEAALLTAQVGEELRSLARHLRPPLLDDVGLAAAIRQLAGDFRAMSGIATFASPIDVDGTGLPDADIALFRVAQAALRNAADHSAASRVEIGLRRTRSTIILTVCDNGVGLLPESGKAMTTGFSEMRHRMRSVGGTLVVRSRLDAGTLVSATVPVAATAAPQPG